MASITHAACRANKGCKDARQHVGCDYRTLYGGVLGRVTSPEAGKDCQPVMVTNSAGLNIWRTSASSPVRKSEPVRSRHAVSQYQSRQLNIRCMSAISTTVPRGRC